MFQPCSVGEKHATDGEQDRRRRVWHTGPSSDGPRWTRCRGHADRNCQPAALDCLRGDLHVDAKPQPHLVGNVCMVDGHELVGFDGADVGERHEDRNLYGVDWFPLHERHADVKR